MNLKQLEHLIAVAEEGSLAAAARRVHLSQPALTRSIQALEEQAGMALFERGVRGVTLTAAGQMVLERARRITFETGSLRRDLLLIQQHEIGRVRFGLGPLAAAIMLGDVLASLQTNWPGLQVAAEVDSGEALLAALHAEQIDFAVIEQRFVSNSAEVEIRQLGIEPAGCFVRPGHSLLKPDATGAQLRRAALASVPFPKFADENLRKALQCRPSEKLRFQVESTDFHALVHMATRSDIVLFAPVRAVATEVRAGTLIQLKMPEVLGLSLRFGIARLAQRTLSGAAERAIGALEAISWDDSRPA